MRHHVCMTLLVASLLVGSVQSLAADKVKAEVKPTYVLGLRPGQDIATYPACDSPEGAEKICLHDLVMTGMRFIELRPDTPKFLASNAWVTVDQAGLIQAYSYETHGMEVQDDVFQYLSERLGKPSSKKIVPMQNGFGATFQTIEATWITKDKVYVTFQGVDKKIDKGLITVVGGK